MVNKLRTFGHFLTVVQAYTDNVRGSLSLRDLPYFLVPVRMPLLPSHFDHCTGFYNSFINIGGDLVLLQGQLSKD